MNIVNSQSDVKKPNGDLLKGLYQLRDEHALWKNPLLIACAKGRLDKESLKHLFSQYYYISKNFSRLLAAILTHCEDDYYRARLSENLWEEGGQEDISKRHTVLFENFLSESLGIRDFSRIKFRNYTTRFFTDCLSICMSGKVVEASAVLALAVEGIVGRLYGIFKKGLMGSGISENELTFFDHHIECDDGHAKVLEEFMLSFQHKKNWYKRCYDAIHYSLNLRNAFFSNICCDLQVNKLLQSSHLQKSKRVNFSYKKTNNERVLLYKNQIDKENIKFTVSRVPVHADVLDPRITKIYPGKKNELHSHMHETVIYVLSGLGKVFLEESLFPIKSGDVVYIPRWSKHQVYNIGNEELLYLAVTDHGLISRFVDNADSYYRMAS